MSVRLYAMTCGWLTMPLHMFLDGEEGERFARDLGILKSLMS